MRALAEAASEKPALVIDMATLTGAARVALGPECRRCSAMMKRSRADCSTGRSRGRPAVANAIVAALSQDDRKQRRRHQ